MSKSSNRFRLYFRLDQAYDDSLIKIAISDGFHWLTADEMRVAYDGLGYPDGGAMLRMSERILLSRGITRDGMDLLLQGKQCHFKGATLPLQALADLGWEILPYPHKFAMVEDVELLLGDVIQYGLSLDVSNLIGDERMRHTEGRVVKGVVDMLKTNGIDFFLYTDHKLWDWLRKKMRWQDAYDYLMSFYDVPKHMRRIVTPPKGKTADELMLYWANRRNSHLLSRDEFDEFDLQYSWVLHGAECGHPRMHKYVFKGGRIIIPDLGLSAEIPSSY